MYTKAACRTSSEENTNCNKSIKCKAKKDISKAIRQKDQDMITELRQHIIKCLGYKEHKKFDSKKVDKKRCMTGSDGKMCYCENRGKIRKDYMKSAIYEKKLLHAIEGKVDYICRNQVVQALNVMKT